MKINLITHVGEANCCLCGAEFSTVHHVGLLLVPEVRDRHGCVKKHERVAGQVCGACMKNIHSKLYDWWCNNENS